MGNRLNARIKAYQNAVKKNSSEAELMFLKAKIRVAQEDYDTTPAGLEALQKQVNLHPDDVELKNRLLKSQMVRNYQINALTEIKNGRAAAIAEIYSKFYPEYDKDEIFSLLETLREENEKENIRRIQSNQNENVPAETNNMPNYEQEYEKFLEKFSGFDEDSEKHINNLKRLSPPDQPILKAYIELPQNMSKSKAQLNLQIKEIATLQNTTLEIAKKYYQAYRAQYKQFYQNKPSSQQPNPPAHWVKGEFENSGYSQSPTSKYAPHDKASMYAAYRLRTDDNAIPNYMKQTKQFVVVDLADNNYIMTTYTPNGKKIKQEIQAKNTHPALLHQELVGKVLLQTQSTPPNIASSRVINQNDYISKHFDFPSYKTSTIRQQLMPDAHNPLELYLTARQKAKKVWNNKAARFNAPPIVLDPFSFESQRS